MSMQAMGNACPLVVVIEGVKLKLDALYFNVQSPFVLLVC